MPTSLHYLPKHIFLCPGVSFKEGVRCLSIKGCSPNIVIVPCSKIRLLTGASPGQKLHPAVKYTSEQQTSMKTVQAVCSRFKKTLIDPGWEDAALGVGDVNDTNLLFEDTSLHDARLIRAVCHIEDID